MQTSVWQWEDEHERGWRRAAAEIWRTVRKPIRLIAIVGVAFVLGVQSAGRSVVGVADAHERLSHAEIALKAREGELELVRLELSRLSGIMEYSARYGIPADLASSIHDIALAEGIDADLAFRLVRVESGFARRAVSPVGAVGLAQVMPRTANDLDPTVGYSDLFDPETNLHLGFRYLREMLERYGGDVRLALLAYNRGPGTVDGIRQAGGDPENGYSQAVLGY
jgi:soluble lytic murein transglycosylase-like protein